MVDVDNPAGRLHTLLTGIKKTRRPQQEKLRTVLVKILGVPDDDEAELLRRLASVLELPGQIRAAVARLPMDGSSLVVKLGSIESALLHMPLSSPASKWTAGLKDDAMHELTICSSMLHQHVPEGKAKQQQITDLRAAATELIEDIKDAEDLPVDLRSFLLDHLHEVQRALDLHQVVGLDALRRAFERLVGGVALNQGLVSSAREKPIWGKFGKMVASLSLLFVTANQGTELVEKWFPEALPSASSVEGRDDAHQTIVIEAGAVDIGNLDRNQSVGGGP